MTEPQPFAEEARKLLAVVQEWAQQHTPAAETGAPCQWCPLCQFAGVLRGEHAEVSNQFAEAGAAVANALRAVLEAAARHAPAPPTRRPSPHPRVQHISLDEEQ